MNPLDAVHFLAATIPDAFVVRDSPMSGCLVQVVFHSAKREFLEKVEAHIGELAFSGYFRDIVSRNVVVRPDSGMVQLTYRFVGSNEAVIFEQLVKEIIK